jgi:hypothetical protein
MAATGDAPKVSSMAVIDTVENLLVEAGIKFTRDENVITMHWKTDHFDDLKVMMKTNLDESWTYVAAPFSSLEKVPQAQRMVFLYDMLKESWRVNGVKYVVDNEDNIMVIAETNDTSLTSQEVQMLVNNVVHACDVLWEIYPREPEEAEEPKTSRKTAKPDERKRLQKK